MPAHDSPPCFPPPRPLRIAITGGIASGKSVVGRWLQQQGYSVIDADESVHALLAEDADVHAALNARFGDAVFDAAGTISRPLLGEQVFANADARHWLEALLHPKVAALRESFFEAHGGEAVVFALIPLLFETGGEASFDESWLIASSPEQQLHRLHTLRGLSLADAQARIDAQWPLDEKRRRATRVFENDASIEGLLATVQTTLETLLNTRKCGS